jgi:hypothetical protein
MRPLLRLFSWAACFISLVLAYTITWTQTDLPFPHYRSLGPWAYRITRLLPWDDGTSEFLEAVYMLLVAVLTVLPIMLAASLLWRARRHVIAFVQSLFRTRT